MRSPVIAFSLLCMSAVAYAAAPAQATAPAKAPSAQAFVQGFYDWYTGQMQKDENGDVMGAALKSKRWPMSAAIVTALEEDMAAQAKSPDDIVGIDFDPFLNAQDTCFPYKADKVTVANGRYRVEVFDSNCSDPHPEIPTVIAELEQQKGSWVFVNFIYPGQPGQADSDLLSALKALKDERDHPNQEQQ